MEPNASPCFFCQPLPPERELAESATFVAFFDGFPVSPGRTLVIPKRHMASIFDLPEDDRQELWAQVAKVRSLLAEKFRPGAVNISVNDGTAAGQTVTHAHIHIVPRYGGDVPDPRGGICWIIPNKAKYW